jgi:hypothetical protein
MFARMLHRSPAPRTVRHTKLQFTVGALEGRQLMSLALTQVVSTNVPHGWISDQRLANPKFVPQVVSTNVPHGDAQGASQIINSGNGKV